MLHYINSNILLISTIQLTIVLVLTISVFLVFIVVAIIKMYKLKSENRKMLDSTIFKANQEKKYTDFTESHLYDNNN